MGRKTQDSLPSSICSEASLVCPSDSPSRVFGAARTPSPLRSALGTVLGCLLLALGATGCGSSSSEGPGETSQRQLVDKVAASTIALKGRIGRDTAEGSGVIFDALQGLALTNSHLVWGVTTLEATASDGTQVHGIVAARAPCEDLAVIRLHPRPAGVAPLPLGNSETLSPGDHVTAMGYGSSHGGSQPKLRETEGPVSVSGISAKVDSALPKLSSVVEHQAPVEAAASGGPLVNDKAELVGLNVSIPTHGADGSEGGLSHAIAGTRVRRILGSHFTPHTVNSYFSSSARRRCHHGLDTLTHELHPTWTPGMRQGEHVMHGGHEMRGGRMTHGGHREHHGEGM